METPGERLRAARQAAGYPSAAALARRITGIHDSTVRAHEADARGITSKRARQYASTLKVPANWILYGGAGGPDDTAGPPPRPAEIIEIGKDEYASIAIYPSRAAAGAGAVANDTEVGRVLFRLQWLRSVSRAPLDRLGVIEVDGDSMEPALRSGDHVLVDTTETRPRRKDGLYVLRADDGLQVKRVSAHPVTGILTIASDNPAYPTYPDIKPNAIQVLGRVIWLGRRV